MLSPPPTLAGRRAADEIFGHQQSYEKPTVAIAIERGALVTPVGGQRMKSLSTTKVIKDPQLRQR
jgi:hypothetical protein